LEFNIFDRSGLPPNKAGIQAGSDVFLRYRLSRPQAAEKGVLRNVQLAAGVMVILPDLSRRTDFG
jgi:hypothetical protein